MNRPYDNDDSLLRSIFWSSASTLALKSTCNNAESISYALFGRGALKFMAPHSSIHFCFSFLLMAFNFAITSAADSLNCSLAASSSASIHFFTSSSRFFFSFLLLFSHDFFFSRVFWPRLKLAGMFSFLSVKRDFERSRFFCSKRISSSHEMN